MAVIDSGGADDFPVRDFDSVVFSHDRYLGIFEWPEDLRQKDLSTAQSGLPQIPKDWVPVMIEAPVSSVEIIEAILKPEQPFQIYKTHHVPCRRVTQIAFPQDLTHRQRVYDEYARFQGRLERDDREVSFICIPRSSLRRLRAFGICWPVCLHYISISFAPPCAPIKDLCHPWAVVLRLRPSNGVKCGTGLASTTNAERLHALLEKLGIPGCRFERSLLQPGTIPLPECVLDWIEGISGSTLALPYFPQDSQANMSEGEDSDITLDHLDN